MSKLTLEALTVVSQSPSNRGNLSQSTPEGVQAISAATSQSPSNRGNLSQASASTASKLRRISLNPLLIGGTFLREEIARDLSTDFVVSQSPSNRGNLSQPGLYGMVFWLAFLSQSPSNRGNLSQGRYDGPKHPIPIVSIPF